MGVGAVMKHSGELWLTERQKGYGKPSHPQGAAKSDFVC
jgi:hypothetical protein